MKPITKPTLMARLFVEDIRLVPSLRVGVDFSIVTQANGVDTPEFDRYGFDTPKAIKSFDSLSATSHLTIDDYRDKGTAGLWGHKLRLDMQSPEFGLQLTEAYAAGNKVLKKLTKIQDAEGEPGDFAQYLNQLFRVMNVKYITCESFSEKQYNQKWKGYKLTDIPFLLEKLCEQGATIKRWNLQDAA